VGDISSVPFESFNVFDFGFECLSVADGDGAVGAEFVEDGCDEVSDLFVSIS
jgi:hypothetical protein